MEVFIREIGLIDLDPKPIQSLDELESMIKAIVTSSLILFMIQSWLHFQLQLLQSLNLNSHFF